MKPGNATLTAALAARERIAAHVIRLGGQDMSTQVQSWALDRAYSTDLPDAMRAFSGSASAQADIALSGKGGASAPALYGPWAPRASGDVARPRQSVVHSWGLGTHAMGTLPTFRGTVRSRSAQSGEDTVRLSALDGAERLRMPAQLPRPAGGIDPATPYGDATNWVASDVWCVDHLLMGSGVHTAPPPRAGCILYASMHGGAAANVGYLKTLSGNWEKWSKKDAPWECSASGNRMGGTWAKYIPQMRPVNRNHSDGLWLEIWAKNTSRVPATVDSSIKFSLSWDAGKGVMHTVDIKVDFREGAVTYSGRQLNPPQEYGPVETYVDALKSDFGRWHLGFWLTVSSGGTAAITGHLVSPRDPLIEISRKTIPTMDVPPGAMADLTIDISSIQVEGLQLSQLAAKPSSVAARMQEGMWDKSATLDEPKIPVRMLPAVSGSAWDAITQIARATLSTAEFDSAGVFRWRGPERWQTPPEKPDLTVTSERELASLTLTEEIDACRNHCSVRWASWYRVKANMANVKEAINVIQINPGQTRSIAWTVGNDELDTTPPATAETVVPDTIRFGSAQIGRTPVVHGAVEVGTHREDGKLVLSMRNRSSETVWLRGNALNGLSLSLVTPTMDSGASPTEHWEVSQDSTSQRYYGVQQYEHDAQGWIQQEEPAQRIAEILKSAGAYPIPLLGDVEILPDPRIELGDAVRVVDSTGAQLDTLAWVIGIKLSAENGEIRQTLTLRGTTANGPPKDAGLTPDRPTDPTLTPW
ncbi:hypothetical protein [Streptomyces spectabilis]|uniref:Uncharacterized protein n=1 Tax=Streptomyces spectabilis TaxID=68270 RepID=A0A5P2X9H9_STRST|nr:hypothetical protein [Streptomyces spectabilis]MBB5103332.1 hypothetical protein [Streptomyces spectabilis]MCI3902522.1 hypothetical protein [Streptomyces spectabilis]QEV59855.1 hypothetical protein CP982_14830 [Streptomyces spectabilis]GGV54230.1 hypothetical protein GCM10010245_85690 [Streptomyces spectabilis]